MNKGKRTLQAPKLSSLGKMLVPNFPIPKIPRHLFDKSLGYKRHYPKSPYYPLRDVGSFCR